MLCITLLIVMLAIDWSSWVFDFPFNTKTNHFKRVPPNQLLSMVLKKLNLAQQKQTPTNRPKKYRNTAIVALVFVWSWIWSLFLVWYLVSKWIWPVLTDPWPTQGYINNRMWYHMVNGVVNRCVSTAQDISPVGHAAAWQLSLSTVYWCCHSATASWPAAEVWF